MTDWDVFREAVMALLHGHNPYSAGQGEMLFFNPVWTLFPLIPMAVLPRMVGHVLNALVSMISLMFVTKRLKIKVWDYFLIAISPMHLHSMLYGNIEWMPLLGLLCPPPLAMVFYSTKPQAASGLILLLLWQQWKENKWKGVAKTVAPTLALVLISLAVFGFPPVPGGENPGQRSLFPFSLLVGIPALVIALRQNDEKLAMFSGPFTAPYVTFHGYLPAIFAFEGKWLLLAVIVGFIPIFLGLVS